MKWKDWKLHYAFMPEPRVTEPPLMRLFNLRSDPREETDIKDVNPWAPPLFDRIVAEYAPSLERFPNVPPNARDPYGRPGGGSSRRAGGGHRLSYERTASS